MKHFIRIVQTGAVDTPEMHEDAEDTKDVNGALLLTVQNRLKSKMIAENYKYQKHICDHDESNRQGCTLEDI